jgi:CheY-like chemotaxis protein
MSSIHLRCYHCSARIKAPVKLIGKMRNCPRCDRRILIHRKAPDDAGPMMLFDDFPALNEVITSSAKPPEEKVILLVDDDRELNDGLRSVLERQGHRVIQAFDGLQAREMILEKSPDLMVLDMMMPRLGGYPVLEYFHKRPEAPPIIMITAREGAQHRRYAEHLGVVDFLNKPFGIESFLESIEKALRDRQGEVSETAGK